MPRTTFLKDINFELRKGEVLGIAGLQGSGRTEMAQAIFGVVPFKTGTVELHGKADRDEEPFPGHQKPDGFCYRRSKSGGHYPQATHPR